MKHVLIGFACIALTVHIATAQNIGIGTASPQAGLHLLSDNGILATGTVFGGAQVIPSGAGTRLLWYPGKGAFRAGHITNDQWDDINIGAYSVALGFNPLASGVQAVALGTGKATGPGSTAFGTGTASALNATSIGTANFAEGNYSTAIGRQSTATGLNAVVIGHNSAASGVNSIAIGSSVVAGADYATALGRSTLANGISSTALGYGTTALGENATAMGLTTSASGENSTAMGFLTSASATHATAMGASTQASDSASTAMGANTIADGFASTSMGFATTASGDYSTAMGRESVASENTATAIGHLTQSNGTGTVAMGIGTQAQPMGCISLGMYNVSAIGSSNQWVSTNPILIVGNGQNASDRSTALTILKNGRVGIGTTNPQHLLHVAGNIHSTSSITVSNNITANLNITALGNISGNTLSAGQTINADHSSSPVLQLKRSGINTGFVQLSNNDMRIGTNSGNSDGQFIIRLNGANRVFVTPTGDMGIGTDAPSSKLHVVGNVIASCGLLTCSDKRYKTDIVPLTGTLSKVGRLQSVYYHWDVEAFPDKGFSTERTIGILAQDLQQEYPELVHTDNTGFMTVDYPKLSAVLLSAINELKVENDLLRTQVDALNALQGEVAEIRALLHQRNTNHSN